MTRPAVRGANEATASLPAMSETRRSVKLTNVLEVLVDRRELFLSKFSSFGDNLS